jgi:hypothetical protein
MYLSAVFLPPTLGLSGQKLSGHDLDLRDPPSQLTPAAKKKDRAIPAAVLCLLRAR